MNSSSSEKGPFADGDLVREVVRELAPVAVAKVDPDMGLVSELGFDSLGLIEVVVALEDAFELPHLDLESIGPVELVADLERALEDAVSANRLAQEAR